LQYLLKFFFVFLQKTNIKPVETILSFFSSHYPTIGIITVVAFIVYKATLYHVSIQSTRKKVEKLPCDHHQRAIDDVEKALLKKMEKLPCDYHQRAIVNIEKTLLSKKRFKAQLTVAQSPRKLSELGHGLYQKSGMQTVLDDNMPHFIEKIENINPTSALDVEDMAYSVLFNSTSESIFKPVKDWLFNNPVFNELDIDMSAICYVASIELRDAYLGKHPEMLPVEV
jgi:hypothetical protein